MIQDGILKLFVSQTGFQNPNSLQFLVSFKKDTWSPGIAGRFLWTTLILKTANQHHFTTYNIDSCFQPLHKSTTSRSCSRLTNSSWSAPYVAPQDNGNELPAESCTCQNDSKWKCFEAIQSGHLECKFMQDIVHCCSWEPPLPSGMM